MRRLWRFSYLSLIGLALLLTTIRTVAGARPNILSGIFSNPDGSPCQQSCLFGIHVGETQMLDAAAILEMHPLTRNFAKQIATSELISFRQQNSSVSVIVVGSPSGIVESVLLSANGSFGTGTQDTLGFIPNGATVGDLMILVGTPRYTWNSGTVYILRRDDELAYSTAHHRTTPRFKMQGAVTGIQVTATYRCLEKPLTEEFRRWRGFITFRQFRQLQAERLPMRELGNNTHTTCTLE
jgi:hypothetical protein